MIGRKPRPGRGRQDRLGRRLAQLLEIRRADFAHEGDPVSLRFRQRRQKAARGREHRAALSDRAREKALGEWRGHKRADGFGPGGFPRDRHHFRIAAESRDVASDPLQRRDQIQHAIVAGRAMLRFAAQFRMGEKAERVEAVVQGHHHDAVGGEPGSVIARLRARADDKSAAVNPDHDGKPVGASRRSRRPDIDIETVLGDAANGRVDVVEDDALKRVGSEGFRRPHAAPRRDGLRRAPAQRPDWRRGVRNALIGANAARAVPGRSQSAALDGENNRRHGRPLDRRSITPGTASLRRQP